jgi:hypothetical protein
VRIIYRKTGEVLAEGKRGWAITPFEGNLYISRAALQTEGFSVNYVPGICFYKFLYVWLDFHSVSGDVEKFLGWKYWLPNPLLPFIWFRIAVPSEHPALLVIEDGESH